MVKHSKNPARKGNVNRKNQSRKRGKKSGKMSRKSRLLNSINKRKKRKTKISRGNNLIKGGGLKEDLAQYTADIKLIKGLKADDLDKIINRINYIKTFLFHLINEKQVNNTFTDISNDVREDLGQFIFEQGKVKRAAIEKELGSKIPGDFKINNGNLPLLMTGGMMNIFGRKAKSSSNIKITISKGILDKFHKQQAVHGDKNYLIQVKTFLDYIRQYTDCVKAINFYSNHQGRVKRGNPFKIPRIVPRTNMNPVEVNLGYKAEGASGIVRLDDEPDHEVVARKGQREIEARETQWLEKTKGEALTRLKELVQEIEFISYIFKKRLENVGASCVYPDDLYKFINDADIDTNKFDDVIELLEKISQINIGLVPTIRYKSIQHYNGVKPASAASQSLPAPPELVEKKRRRLAGKDYMTNMGLPTSGVPSAGVAQPPPQLQLQLVPVPVNDHLQIFLARREADIAEMERLSAPAEAQPIYAAPLPLAATADAGDAADAAATADAGDAGDAAAAAAANLTAARLADNFPADPPLIRDALLERKVNDWFDKVNEYVETAKSGALDGNLIAAHPIPKQDNLPPGWEIRYDRRDGQNKKPYYVNHNTRETQWEFPTAVAAAATPRPQLQFEPSSHDPDFSEEDVLRMLAEQLTEMGVVPGDGELWKDNLDTLLTLYSDTFQQASTLTEHLGIMVDLFLRQRESNSNPKLTVPKPEQIAASVSDPVSRPRPIPAPRPRRTFKTETIIPLEDVADGERIVSILLPGN